MITEEYGSLVDLLVKLHHVSHGTCENHSTVTLSFTYNSSGRSPQYYFTVTFWICFSNLKLSVKCRKSPPDNSFNFLSDLRYLSLECELRQTC